MKNLNENGSRENSGGLFLAMPTSQAPQTLVFFDVELRVQWLVSQSNESVQFHREIMLTNYSGTRFELAVDRKIQLISAKQALAGIGAPHPAGVSVVACESVNAIKNTGAVPWTRSTGELSIWILGQFNASDQSTVVIPFKPGSESERGIIMNDSYFGKVPADRLVAKDGVLFFCADAKFRCKIGIPPRRARSVLGSYDAVHHTLTLVKFTLPPGVTDYVNSMWKLQTYPFSGDVVNSYNDDGNLAAFTSWKAHPPHSHWPPKHPRRIVV